MKDRVPVNPGRVLITPENGSAAYYATMTRADNPTQEGDPLNKNTLLKDATAALFDLSGAAVPDDVFNKLSAVFTHCWKRYDMVEATYALGAIKTISVAGESSVTLSYSDTVSVDDDGNATLGGTINQVSVKYGTNGKNSLNALAGKFFLSSYGELYYMPNADAYSQDFTLYAKVQPVTGIPPRRSDDFTIVSSADENEYPHAGESGGYYYEYCGIPIDNAAGAAKITTGSYTGTGTYGAANPNSLTFDFVPKLVWIFECANSSTWWVIETVMNPAVGGYRGKVGGGSDTRTGTLSLSGKTLSWYGSSASYQLNTAGTVFHYIAFG